MDGKMLRRFPLILYVAFVLTCPTKTEAYPEFMLMDARCTWHINVGDKVMFDHLAIPSSQIVTLNPATTAMSAGKNYTINVTEEKILGGPNAYLFDFFEAKNNSTGLLIQKNTNQFFNFLDNQVTTGCGGWRVAHWNNQLNFKVHSPAPYGGAHMKLRILHTNHFLTPIRVIKDIDLFVKGCEEIGEVPCRIISDESSEPHVVTKQLTRTSCLDSISNSQHALQLDYKITTCIQNSVNSESELHVRFVSTMSSGWLGLGFHDIVLSSKTKNYMHGAKVVMVDLPLGSNSLPTPRVGIGNGRTIIHSGVQPILAELIKFSHDNEGMNAFDIVLKGTIPKTWATLIWCVGNTGSLHHKQQGVGIYNFQSGNDFRSINLDPSVSIISHAIIMSMAWLIFAPISVLLLIPTSNGILDEQIESDSHRIAKRSLVQTRSFQMHYFLGILILSLTIIGFALSYSNVASFERKHFRNRHGKLGLSVLIIIILHVILALLRPRQTHKSRKNLWSMFHRVCGITLLVLTLITVLYGLHDLNGFTDASIHIWKTAILVWNIFIFGLIFLKFTLRSRFTNKQ